MQLQGFFFPFLKNTCNLSSGWEETSKTTGRTCNTEGSRAKTQTEPIWVFLDSGNLSVSRGTVSADRQSSSLRFWEATKRPEGQMEPSPSFVSEAQCCRWYRARTKELNLPAARQQLLHREEGKCFTVRLQAGAASINLRPGGV